MIHAKFAGQIRDYNISKKGWILQEYSVCYGDHSDICVFLKHDFDKEKAFDYSKP